MVEPATVSPELQLEARPPTPPRESERKEAQSSSFPGRFISRESSGRRSSSSAHLTPPDSSSIESPNITGSIRKKVGWAESHEFSEPPVVSFNGEELSHPVQHLPPSAERKPTKSILKAYNASQEKEHSIGSNTKLLPPHQHATFAIMLESIVQQLAGNDRTSKIDAYLMLSSSLKASDNVPDIKALKYKMPQLCQHIIQDLTSKVESGKADSNLAVNALVLLASFLQKASIAESLPPEFQVNVVEYTIKSFLDGSTSKEVIRHLMFILAQQNFSSKIMSQERIGRLIHALHNVEHQAKGKSVITGRLQAYRNLLRRSKTHMLGNFAWVEDLFVDMRSSNKDTRSSAITFGLEASLVLGTESSAGRAISELFKGEHSEGVSFAEFYASRLKTMVKTKDEGAAVPQIWSVIILFIRAKPQMYEQWSSMGLFLGVLSDCFNSSDASTKSEANLAWNRFIFAAQLDEKTSPGTRARLLTPLISQLKQRKSQTARKSALNSIYHLLYYAFSPNSTQSRLDLYWDEYVIPLMKALIVDDVRNASEIVKSSINEACTILLSLLDTTTQRPWSENRVMEDPQQISMSVKELPGLDAIWIRSRVTRVVPVLSALLEKLYWELGGDDSTITRVWQMYIKTIALPAMREVKVSIDTMGCIASLFGTLHKLWTAGRIRISSLPQSKGPHGPNTTGAFLKSFETILLITIEGLGPLAFTEKLLSISQDTFIAVATPSAQPKRVRSEIKCPLYHLVLFLMTPSPDLEYDQRFSSMVHRILAPFFEARKSSRSKKEFVKDLYNLLPLDSTEPCKLIWQVLADFASLATDLRDKNGGGRHNEEPLGSDYREIMKILEAGIQYSPSYPLPGWKVLFEALVTSATLDAGDAGRALAVIEPLAKILLPKDGTPLSLPYLHILLSKASYPKDRQALEAARKRLWGFANSTPKAAFDPYVSLYDYVRLSLSASYLTFSKPNITMYADVIAGTSNLLSRCPKSLLLGMLKNIQEGVAPWIIDPDSQLSGGNSLSQAILSFWSVVGNSVSQILQSQKHTKVLKELEALICSGLESQHKAIVNSTIRSWNSTFGSSKENLEYPDRMKSALVRLRPIADILLPFLPESLEAEISVNQAQRIEFAETQDDSTIYPGASSMEAIFKPSVEDQWSPMTRRMRQTTPQVILSSLRTSSANKRLREPTPDARGRRLKKRDITPKARHDDSQIEFEAVPSSPIVERVVDSQLLTVKQKETRERQQAEAAMFPDLRSSPRIREKITHVDLLEDPELPLHQTKSRSRGRSHSKHSPEPQRQTTPTLALPSDDDQYVQSSPTPTRPVQKDVNILDPPSSPPESAIKKRAAPDEDFPSSPPESIPDVENDTIMSFDFSATSQEPHLSAIEEYPSSAPINLDMGDEDDMVLDPSAQINPYAMTNNPTLSTWQSTADKLSSSPADDPSDQLRADASQNHIQKSDIQVGDEHEYGAGGDAIEESVLVFDAVNDPEPPEKPIRILQDSALRDKALKYPQFVDAPTSPSSSEVDAGNGDIFEDAISSPRLHIGKAAAKNPSSPFSDIDEGSMLRIVSGFDLGPGRTAKEVSLLDEEENQPHGILPAVYSSSADAASPVPNSPVSKTPAAGQQKQEQDREPAVKSYKLQSSSIPSLVPETPGSKSTETVAKYFDDDGEAVDMSVTIVVDTSRLEEEQRFTAKRKGHRRGRKRRIQEMADDHNEVPYSQDTFLELEASTSPQKKSPSKKRQRTSFTTRSSQISFQSEASFELGQDVSQARLDLVCESEIPEDHNLVLVEIEAQNNNRDIVDQAASANPHLPGSENMEDMEIASESDIPDVEYPEFPQAKNEEHADAMTAEAPKAAKISKDTVFETIEETTIEDSIAENSNSAPARSKTDPRKEAKSDSPPEISEAELSTAVVEQNREVAVQVELGFSARLIESIKGRLRSVVGDLGLLGLGRRETLEIEDLFMDGKRALYQAESRGRDSEGR